MKIDNSENASGIPDILESEYGLNVTRARLKAGDYLFDNGVAAERKTARDFVQSIIDGRLFRQAGRMKRLFKRQLMIIEGDTSSLSEITHIHPHAVHGALISIAVSWQIPVLFSKDAQETALFLWLIHHQGVKPMTELSCRPGRRPKRLAKKQLHILESLPGVGAAMSVRLFDHFQSVKAVMTASEKDLMRIRGLGQRKAGKIREVLTGKSAPPLG